MDPDAAALTLDLRTILDALAGAAQAAAGALDEVPADAHDPSIESILSFLDVEARVLFDVADRALADGPDLTAVGRQRHGELSDALRDRDVEALRAALDAHIETERTTLYSRLVLDLDDDEQADLAAALEEARLSRQEREDVPSQPLDS